MTSPKVQSVAHKQEYMYCCTTKLQSMRQYVSVSYGTTKDKDTPVHGE